MSRNPNDRNADLGGGSGLLDGVSPIDISAFPPIQDDVPLSQAIPLSTTSSSSGGAGAFGTDTVTHGGSGLVFVNTYGAGVTTAFHNVIIAAETYLESHFTNSITIHASFDLQALNHAFSGQNSFSTVQATYSQLVSALQSHATSPDDTAAVNALNSIADPSGGLGFTVSNAEAKLLGLPGTTNGTDDSVILNNFYWNDSSITANPGDAIAVLMHELTEGAMGRIGGLWGPMDLFRYTASGQHDYTGGQDGQLTYFSPNGQNINTGLQFHNPINSSGVDDGFDWADWDQVGQDASARDPFGPGGPGAGDPGILSKTDLQIMDVLGWTKAPAPNRDFNGDAVGDILWRDGSGNLALWNIANYHIASTAGLGNVGTNWAIAGVGDFNGDGMNDILWRDNTGNTSLWEMNGSALLSGAGLGNISTNWSVAGVGDFNGDGKSDILWRDTSGNIAMWEMNGPAVIAGGGLGNVPNSWTIAGLGDFNGDSKTDILWRDSAGNLALWEMNGTAVLSGAGVGSAPAGWSISGIGDFNGDGYADILWKDLSGNVTVWDMNGSSVLSTASIGTVPTNWTVDEVTDFNGDGKADILWQDPSGKVTLWEMNGSSVQQSVTLANVGTNWHAA